MNDFSMDTSDHDGSLSGARNDASKLSGSNVLGNEKELAYRTLGLCGPAATASDVRTAYRHLALMYHPDKVKGDAAMKKAAQDRFTGIGAAYDLLSKQMETTILPNPVYLHGAQPPCRIPKALLGFGGTQANDGKHQGSHHGGKIAGLLTWHPANDTVATNDVGGSDSMDVDNNVTNDDDRVRIDSSTKTDSSFFVDPSKPSFASVSRPVHGSTTTATMLSSTPANTHTKRSVSSDFEENYHPKRRRLLSTRPVQSTPSRPAWTVPSTFASLKRPMHDSHQPFHEQHTSKRRRSVFV